VSDKFGNKFTIPEEDESPLEKPASQLKRSELAERSKRIAARQQLRKAQQGDPTRLPTPNLDQANAMVTAMVINRTSQSQGSLANGIPLMPLVNRIIAGKVSQGE
jgi:hypothetical protein